MPRTGFASVACVPESSQMRFKRSLPTAESLHDAALNYLARYAATEAGLTRVLNRRIARWLAEQQDDPEAAAAAASIARAAAREVVTRLVSSGAVNDATFAGARARSLSRAGKSQRAIAAHLSQRGVAQVLVAEALPTDDDDELAAALIHARRRRAGPYGNPETTPEATRRVLASFARAGFSQGVAASALRMERDEAEALIAAFRAKL